MSYFYSEHELDLQALPESPFWPFGPARPEGPGGPWGPGGPCNPSMIGPKRNDTYYACLFQFDTLTCRLGPNSNTFSTFVAFFLDDYTNAIRQQQATMALYLAMQMNDIRQ